MDCVALEDLTLEQLEGALDGSGSGLTVICPDCRWSSIDFGPLSAEEREAIASARRTGYLVTAAADPWPIWRAWLLRCRLAGQPGVCAWQRPRRKGVVELRLPAGSQLGAAAGPMWAMATEYARTVAGGEAWVIAEGVDGGQLQLLAGAMATVARKALGCAA